MIPMDNSGIDDDARLAKMMAERRRALDREHRLAQAAPVMLALLQRIAAPFEAAGAAGMPLALATIRADSGVLKEIRAVLAEVGA